MEMYHKKCLTNLWKSVNQLRKLLLMSKRKNQIGLVDHKHLNVVQSNILSRKVNKNKTHFCRKMSSDTCRCSNNNVWNSRERCFLALQSCVRGDIDGVNFPRTELTQLLRIRKGDHRLTFTHFKVCCESSFVGTRMMALINDFPTFAI